MVKAKEERLTGYQDRIKPFMENIHGKHSKKQKKILPASRGKWCEDILTGKCVGSEIILEQNIGK